MALSKEQIELAALDSPPGILPPDTEFESYIGHNVINISNIDLNEHQVSALEKGLTFCPTPKGPDKSEIWNVIEDLSWYSSSNQMMNIPMLILVYHKAL